MCANNAEKSKEYKDARSSFDDLGSNEKAVFLVESAIQMVVQGVREAGDVVSDALKNISVDFPEAEDGEEAAEEAAEEAPKKKAASSTAGKTKKKAAPKKAAKKDADKAEDAE